MEDNWGPSEQTLCPREQGSIRQEAWDSTPALASANAQGLPGAQLCPVPATWGPGHTHTLTEGGAWV